MSNFHFLDPWISHPAIPSIENLPQELMFLVSEVSKIDDQEMAVRYVYDELTKKYRGSRLLTFLRLDRFFITNLDTLWKNDGFLHCNHLNLLFRTILVASGKFSPEDITTHWTHIWFFSPHQYIDIRLNNSKILSIDLWGKVYGIPFGEHAYGFQSGNLFCHISK